MSGLQHQIITRKIVWGEHLVTLELDVSVDNFASGQFFNLGLEKDGKVIRRSYSAASAPGRPLQFFLSEVNQGELTPGLFTLNEGDSVLLDPAPLGFFTLAEVPEAKVLWLVATGTGLGPYISFLREGVVLERFERVILVHGARHPYQFAYRDELQELERAERRFCYLPVQSGTASTEAPEAVSGRITTAWGSGALEARAGAIFDDASHMLLCGNPQMIEEMAAQLKARGFAKHRRRQPGHFNFEKYWSV